MSSDQLLRICASLIREAISGPAVEIAFSIRIGEGEDIFTALVRHRKASDFKDAVIQIGQRFQPSPDTRWIELAKWVREYGAFEGVSAGGPEAAGTVVALGGPAAPSAGAAAIRP